MEFRYDQNQSLMPAADLVGRTVIYCSQWSGAPGWQVGRQTESWMCRQGTAFRATCLLHDVRTLKRVLVKIRKLPCKHTLRTISIAAHALPSEMSAIVKVESLDTKLPMNDTEDVLSETEGGWREDAFERSESAWFRRLCALTRSRT